MSKQELKNYVVNSIAHNEFNPNELLRLINHLPDQPQLNENQQIVLEWLKDYTLSEAVTPIDTVAIFWKERNWMGQPQKWRMTGKQQAQVLQVFSAWALEQEDE